MKKEDKCSKTKNYEVNISTTNQYDNLNSRFPITWIDILTKEEIDILHSYGIKNLDHLRCYFKRLENISTETKEKLIWAKEFYNLTPHETYDYKNRTINSKFPIEWLNIHFDNLDIFRKHNILNLEQLRKFDLDELESESEITIELLKWTREFYNIDGEPIQYKKSPRKKRRVNNGKLL